MRLSQVIFFGVLIGTVFAGSFGRNRRGLPSGALFVKDPSPATFTGYQQYQQYYYKRPTWGGSYGVSSYGAGTYGYGGMKYGTNFGGGHYYGGGNSGGSSNTGFGSAYG